MARFRSPEERDETYIEQHVGGKIRNNAVDALKEYVAGKINWEEVLENVKESLEEEKEIIDTMKVEE